ncbi:hypothetical protein SAMN05421796_102299 [Chryseobacterium piscicola]|jgi:hypothetical protein|uniref:Uncharacterized protein n=1 Tax=Chryseobacterium piscicola TaxID=551459 RepID=A0A1N7LGB9_9FLAO|nr:hypothetical protein [Chryseobacterium piscicola]PQA97608.1 hypothetical protein B0A70_02805 [Chryseobacterium piscicola]SIS72872.1 hypothetical protein SAMN05421796_102299 [Chryseobacterium piscicola]
MNLKNKFLVETKILSLLALGIIILVILCVWVSGFQSHRTLFENSIISTTILGGTFFLFISLGLYFGLKLKENVGELISEEKLKEIAHKTPLIDTSSVEIPAIGDGIGGWVLGVILWFVLAILAAFLLYFLGVFLWSATFIFAAMLYWVFFRAIRLVFKNSRQCKGDLFKSITFGLFYSFLYSAWIYGIILILHFLQDSEKVIF